MKKLVLHFLIGVILGAAWGYFLDAVNAAQKWAWWPMIIMFVGMGIFNIFTREKISVKLSWLIGFLVGVVLSGVYYWYYLSGSHGFYLNL